MTAFLQVLDFVVNGAIKINIKRMVVDSIYRSFQQYRREFAESASKKRLSSNALKLFVPQLPNLDESLLELFRYVENDCSSNEFRQSIRQSFMDTGTAPLDNEQAAGEEK